MVLAFSCATQAQFCSLAYESVTTRRAADVVPAEICRSPHYTIDDSVTVRENTYAFRVDSELGYFETNSLTLLSIRLNEVATLAQAVDTFNQQNRKFGAKLRGAL
jgi:hypothetical protein